MPAPAPAAQADKPNKFQSMWADMRKVADRSRKGGEKQDAPEDAVYGAQGGQAAPVQDDARVGANEQETQETIDAVGGQAPALGVREALEGLELLMMDTEGTELTDDDIQALTAPLEEAVQAPTEEDAEPVLRAQPQPPAQPGEQVQRASGEAPPVKEQEAGTQKARMEDAPAQSAEKAEGTSGMDDRMRAALLRAAKGQKGEDAPADTPFQPSAEQGAHISQRVQHGAADIAPVEGEAQAAPLTEIEFADNLNRIIEGISANSVEGGQEFDVQLKPEFLGKLSLKLIMDGDGLRAQIKAGDLSIRNMIHAQLPALEAALKERGVNVQQIEVAYEAAAFDFNHRQREGSQNEYAGPNNAIRYAAGLEPVGYDAVLEQVGELGYLHETSSVEFQA